MLIVCLYTLLNSVDLKYRIKTYNLITKWDVYYNYAIHSIKYQINGFSLNRNL